ncbi:hypothetical protein [Pandoravirus japonicus]|uniref:Uncharacterized protein n=1 Tax=Pandoravirus japonicus TaxID=2823154 RepID=A0A811BS89_9VIRU|nr:hypothetical protein [Pandoravirus japonicus]
MAGVREFSFSLHTRRRQSTQVGGVDQKKKRTRVPDAGRAMHETSTRGSVSRQLIYIKFSDCKSYKSKNPYNVQDFLVVGQPMRKRCTRPHGRAF